MIDSELCEIYGWTWQQLQETPYYVRVAFMQIQNMKAEKRNQDAERQAKNQEQPYA